VRSVVYLLLATPMIIAVLRALAAMVVVLRRGQISRCPKCTARRTRQARPRAVDKLLPAFVMTRRCESCKRRYYSAQSVDYALDAKSKVRLTLKLGRAGAAGLDHRRDPIGMR
jgi:hypothetical protein